MIAAHLSGKHQAPKSCSTTSQWGSSGSDQVIREATEIY